MTGMTLRMRLIAAWLGVQLCVPAWLLAHGGQRYDWAMFNRAAFLPRLQVQQAGGGFHEINLNSYLGYGRGDVAVTDRDVPELCRIAGRPPAVRLTRPSGLPGPWHRCP